MYDAASRASSDYICNGAWQFPHPVSNDMVRSVQHLPNLRGNEKDTVIWLPGGKGV